LAGLDAPKVRRIVDMSEHRKRPRDPNQLAKAIVDIATGAVEDRPPTPEEEGKDPGCGGVRTEGRGGAREEARR
jgi:hypothetical protein